jgi:hypothetical protein
MKRGQQRNSTAGHRSCVLHLGAISTTLEGLNGYHRALPRYPEKPRKSRGFSVSRLPRAMPCDQPRAVAVPDSVPPLL